MESLSHSQLESDNPGTVAEEMVNVDAKWAMYQSKENDFAEQCAIREFESNVIKYVMTDLSNLLDWLA